MWFPLYMKILNQYKLMKDIDLRKIIHKHYIGTEITEMKLDAEGKATLLKSTESATFNNTTDHGDRSSERDEEVREATH